MSGPKKIVTGFNAATYDRNDLEKLIKLNGERILWRDQYKHAEQRPDHTLIISTLFLNSGNDSDSDDDDEKRPMNVHYKLINVWVVGDPIATLPNNSDFVVQIYFGDGRAQLMFEKNFFTYTHNIESCIKHIEPCEFTLHATTMDRDASPYKETLELYMKNVHNILIRQKAMGKFNGPASIESYGAQFVSTIQAILNHNDSAEQNENPHIGKKKKIVVPKARKSKAGKNV